jgi:hypothetical protein
MGWREGAGMRQPRRGGDAKAVLAAGGINAPNSLIFGSHYNTGFRNQIKY